MSPEMFLVLFPLPQLLPFHLSLVLLLCRLVGLAVDFLWESVKIINDSPILIRLVPDDLQLTKLLITISEPQLSLTYALQSYSYT